MRGTLLIAGGNVGATEQGRRDIYGRFAALCGGEKGRVMLVVTAGENPQDSWSFNRELLLSFGIGDAVLLPLTENPALVGKDGWTDRADESLLPLFENVTGIWFTGGDQLRTVRLLKKPDGSDSPVLARMRRLLNDGGVIGGSSAGAAIMSRVMLGRGDDAGVLTLPHYNDPSTYDFSGEASPEALLLTLGLGFLPTGVVDQHFNRRARLQRLLAAMDCGCEEKGYGISEDTALEVNLADGTIRVHGSAYVMCVTKRNGCVTIKKLTAAADAVQ